MGDRGRSWGAKAAYTGLAFCGFRVRIDQFNHLSSCQNACCPSPLSCVMCHLSSLASVPVFPLCITLFSFLFLLLCV